VSGTKRTTLLIVAVLLACWMAISVATASPASAASGHAAVSTRQAAALQKNARILIALINKARMRRGLAALRVQHNPGKGGASAFAPDGGPITSSRIPLRTGRTMGRASHGVGIVARATRCGGSARSLLGGKGVYGVPQIVLRRWMSSSVHRAVILDRKWREVGVGIGQGEVLRPAWGVPLLPLTSAAGAADGGRPQAGSFISQGS